MKVGIWNLKEQQYQILKAKNTRAPRTSLLIIPELRVLVLTKRHVGSGNEIAEEIDNYFFEVAVKHFFYTFYYKFTIINIFFLKITDSDYKQLINYDKLSVTQKYTQTQ